MVSFKFWSKTTWKRNLPSFLDWISTIDTSKSRAFSRQIYTNSYYCHVQHILGMTGCLELSCLEWSCINRVKWFVASNQCQVADDLFVLCFWWLIDDLVWCVCVWLCAWVCLCVCVCKFLYLVLSCNVIADGSRACNQIPRTVFGFDSCFVCVSSLFFVAVVFMRRISRRRISKFNWELWQIGWND